VGSFREFVVVGENNSFFAEDGGGSILGHGGEEIDEIFVSDFLPKFFGKGCQELVIGLNEGWREWRSVFRPRRTRL
jgi:hypothetical protein